MATPSVSPWAPGRLILSPGQGAQAVRRERLSGLDRLWLGKPAEAFPARVAAVHALCGQAHRFTAGQALQAARGEALPVPPAELAALRLAMLGEHLRRLLHDWPAAVPLGPAHTAAALAVLRAAPLGQPLTAPAWARWWHDQVLGLPPAAWLDRLAADHAGWLGRWAADTDTPIARWLAAARAEAGAAVLPVRPLALNQDPGLQAWLAARLAAPGAPAFAAAPEGPEGPCETGPWTSQASQAGAHAHNAWMRMCGRLVEAVRLTRPEGEAAPVHGRLSLGPRCGMAWTGTARGLLLHWLRLEERGGAGEVIAAGQIVAPTDWNFHPRGGLAQWLGALAPGDALRRQARWMALAFDACVPVEWLERPDQEQAHA